jgi:hypothetical protein
MSRPAGSRHQKLFALESWRWIEEFDTVRLGTLLQVGKIIWVAAERDVVQLFALALHHDAPVLITTGCPESKRVAVRPHIEAEIAIEALCGRKVRYGEHEMIKRMDASPG